MPSNLPKKVIADFSSDLKDISFSFLDYADSGLPGNSYLIYRHAFTPKDKNQNIPIFSLLIVNMA